MSNIQAVGHYINYCNKESKTTQRDNDGLQLILKLPEGIFGNCSSGEEVYTIVQRELKKMH